MTPFSDPLGGVAPAEWDELTGNLLYSSRQWLTLCAQSGSAAAGAVHGKTAEGTLAAAPVTWANDELPPFYRWQTELAARGLPAPRETGLLVGARRGHQTHLLTPSGTDRTDAARTVLEALTTLEGVAADAPRVAMFLSTDDVLALRAAGVPTLPVLLRADAWIPVPEGGWDAWLDSLPSRRRAELVRRETRRFAAAGYEITDAPLSDWTTCVGRLLTNTEARYGHSAEVDGRIAFLRRQAASMGDAARVLLCSPPGEPPVGYCLYYLKGNTLFLRSAGFDYGRLRSVAEYFNLVYYLPVRIAGEAGARWIHAGVEAAEAKALRGAELRPLWLLDLSRDSRLNGCDADIRAANSRQAELITASGPAARKAWDLGQRAENGEFGVLPTGSGC
ncbi:GNAT family N-acetyltransferase [Streptomyces sp. NPDC005209]|uniref:GNAT family N-acetyltransferase n=1 Tax=Streptomyces sp. NPDC005209 TaxID=3156715 RepID=UPI0033BAF615